MPITLSLDSPSLKCFQLAKHQVIDDIRILSGFYAHVDLEFTAPDETDDVVYSDYLGLFVNGVASHSFLLEANPSGPLLECPLGIDFGVLFCPITNEEKKIWITKDFTIVNNGKKPASVALTCNSRSTIKLSHKVTTVLPQSSTTLQVSFLPVVVIFI